MKDQTTKEFGCDVMIWFAALHSEHRARPKRLVVARTQPCTISQDSRQGDANSKNSRSKNPLRGWTHGYTFTNIQRSKVSLARIRSPRYAGVSLRAPDSPENGRSSRREVSRKGNPHVNDSSPADHREWPNPWKSGRLSDWKSRR